MAASLRGPWGEGPNVVAIGGGHGLAASLRALRRLSDNLVAVVGVADDGGSSGRLRAEFAIPPPGDIRMAIAALCDDDAVGRAWSRLLQHRFGGSGELAGHAVGNLLIAALWEQTGDIVAGLDYVAALVETRGRVLPTTTVPMQLIAEVMGANPAEPEAVLEIQGQANVARSGGRVLDFRLSPADAPGCVEALTAIQSADVVVLGPGSWFTSVLPHLEVADVRKALAETEATRVLVLNLQAHTAETAGLSACDHLEIIARRYPELRFDVVLADVRAVPDPGGLETLAHALGAQVRLERLAAPARAQRIRTAVHSPDLLAAAFASIFDRGRIDPWR